MSRYWTFILLLLTLTFSGVAFGQSPAATALYWQKVSPTTDMVTFRASVEDVGGKVVSLTPEFEALVSLPTTLSSTYRFAGTDSAPRLADVSKKDKMATASTASSPHALGASNDPTTEEQLKILKSRNVNNTTAVVPNALAQARAALLKTSTDSASLDTAVSTKTADNSMSAYFPPIDDQGSLGSCTAWASAYYYNTYTQARDEDLAAKTGTMTAPTAVPAVICSPAFIYPLTNDGVDEGAQTADVVDKLNDVGCATWDLMPYDGSDSSDSTTYTTWPDAASWVEALTYRTKSLNYVQMTDDTSIETVKALLDNGEVLVTRTDIYDNWWKNYGETASGIDNWVLYSHAGSAYGGGHAVTIVGYDDSRSYTTDLNSHLYGAFLIANSWGPDWGTVNGNGEGGYMWVGYEYIKSSGNFSFAYYNTDRPLYRPSVYALTGIDCTDRSAITYTGGLGTPDVPIWTSYQPSISGDGGTLAIDSTKPVAIDLTDCESLITDVETANFFIKVTSTADATIASSTIYKDFDGDGTYSALASSSVDVAVAADATGYMQFPTLTVSSFLINNGDVSTGDTTVTLNNTCTGSTPLYYMASEYSTFKDVLAWDDYTTTPTFNLSAGGGSKKVYFKVQDAGGNISAVVSDTIVVTTPVVTTLAINSGGASTRNRNVILYNICSPTSEPAEYMASESSTFVGADWEPYDDAPSFTLSAGNGTKKVYFKVRNLAGLESKARTDTIVFAGPVVSTFTIKAGATFTTNRTVVLNNTCTGNPTAYAASEFSDFRDVVSSSTYSKTPTFELSADDEMKTVYFKVWNSVDQVSVTKKDTITLSETTVDSFEINGTDADTDTENRVVTLNNTFTGSATSYMASESASFYGAKWNPYDAAPSFTLSAGSGTKKVYLKLKNPSGKISSVKSDTIYLNLPVVSLFKINNGDASVTTRDVTLNNDCTGSTAVTYMASESATFVGATTQTYSSAPTFTLSAGNGTKKVYFKVQNASGQNSVVKSDTIVFRGPLVSTFKINAGAARTSSLSVVLNNTCTGAPTEYMASEASDFSGASWASYSKTPAFTLSTGDGLKKVYFKVRNTALQQSPVKTDTITLASVTAPPAGTATTTAATAATTTAKTTTVTHKPVVNSTVDTPTTPVITTDAVTTSTVAKPTLQVTDYSLSATDLQVGEAFTATLTISNDSDVAAGAFHVAFYLVTDDTLLLGLGYLVDEVAIDGLAARAETTATWDSTMPDLSGTVYPLFVLDSQAEIAPFDATTNLVEPDATLTVAP